MNESSAAQPAIELQRVVKTFKSAAGEFTILKEIDLQLEQGEFVSIIGKSGSGKSTLLNMVTGIDHPSSGRVLVGGVDIHKLSESKRALWRGRTLGIVFQFFQLLPTLTLLENTTLPMDYCNVYAYDERPRRAMELLELMGLEEHAHKLPTAVSIGQQQHAAIARALATDPPIIIADEPTGNLDSRSADSIINMFDSLVHDGKTIVMVTHDPTITDRTMRTVIISDGELVDETVARALPLLTHRQMLSITDLVECRVYQPGQTIIQKDQHPDYFFMIARGAVEIILQATGARQQRSDMVVACLERGEFFGEVELVAGGKTIASVRAAQDAPVELLALHRDDFLRMLIDSPMTEDALAKIVQARVAENRAADRRRR
ncbi:MAG: ATP-binding cassette domain-containing protein [Anaerolineales bacterium]|nr:ATP-binding cassette domain-containing protein [Anaerolineales bacterium]